MQHISLADLTDVCGGQLTGCPVINNYGSSVSVGDAKLGFGESTIVPPGKFDVQADGGTVRETCAPGLGFGVVDNPGKRGDWGVGGFRIDR